MVAAPVTAQRVDRWLWHARLVKTRSLAQDLVRRGRVRRNRVPIDNAASLVRMGDVLTVTLFERVVVVEVIGFAEHRGSAEDARLLKRDLTTLRATPPETGDDDAP